MIASGICTEKQDDSGKKGLIRRIAHFYEGQTARDEAIINSWGTNLPSNEWSSEDSDDDGVFVSPAMELAQKELERFKKYKTGLMNPTHALAIAEMDQDFEEASM